MARRDTKPRSGNSPAEREPGVMGRRGYRLPGVESADPQPSSATVRSNEEYEATERADIDKAKASSARSKASGARAKASAAKTRKGVRKARTDSLKGAVEAVTPPALHRNARNALKAEFLAAVVLITLEELAGGGAPVLASYTSTFVVYLVLAFASEAGEGAARTSAGLGGLVLLAIGMRSAAAIAKGGKVLADQAATPATTVGAPERVMVRHTHKGGAPLITSLEHPAARSSRHLTRRH